MKGWNTPNQSWRDLEEAKTERSRERLITFCRRQQDGSVDSVRQESQLYIA